VYGSNPSDIPTHDLVREVHGGNADINAGFGGQCVPHVLL
jgi:hypothetical protein